MEKNGSTEDSRANSPNNRSNRPWVLGDFRIIREIGSGGMAKVFEAEQMSLRRKVALKVLPQHLSFSDSAVGKFRREAEAGGRQSHPGIVAVYSVGEHEGMHYIAQELVKDGRTLADHLDRLRKSKSPQIGYFRETAVLVLEVADALDHAHKMGVIHRDVKPSNILLTPDGQPKVTDFGLARVEGALALSRTGDFAGTPFYMSPEQAISRRIGIDHRTDIYSLGVTLYEALALKRPFEGKTSHEVLKKIILQEPKDPRKLNPRVPTDLALICLKAMEKDAIRRYQDMSGFRDDLNRYLQGEVIGAKPASIFYKAWKKIKRNPAVGAAALIAVLAVLFLLLNMLWSFSRILSEREKALAINSYLEKIFMAANPDIEGRNVTVAELLDNAAGDIGTELSGQPEVAASVRNTIGYTYLTLGLYNAAAEQHRIALDIRERVLGDEHTDTVKSKNDLAVTLSYLDRLPEAEKLLTEALEAWKRDLGTRHENTLMAECNLASVYLKLGRVSEAEAMLRHVLETRQELLGKDSVQVLQTKSSLASLLMESSRFPDAETILREVLAARKRILGEKHRETLVSMNNLAALLSTSVHKYSDV